MNRPSRSSVVAITAVMLLQTGCGHPTGSTATDRVQPVAYVPMDDPTADVVLPLPAAVQNRMTHPHEVQRLLDALSLREISQNESKYRILVVRPDAAKKYMILRVKPDADKKYQMMVVHPR